ncbi:MAG: type I restriction-modification system subunit M [Planctomycetaceae bacterium]|jgi:type I restriction enzyme M protein|nr:type I restriction-modification system subunit M [Planctomycetaceae bacterium]
MNNSRGSAKDREKAREIAGLIWANADLLRGNYKRADYGKIILPFTVIRRLDFVLEPTKQKVVDAFQKYKDKKPEVLEPLLNRAAGKGMQFHNRSKFTFNDLVKDHQNIAANFRNYLRGFSSHVKEIIDYFSFDEQIKKLDEYNLLFQITEKFTKEETVSLLRDADTILMGLAFEELIRKFAEDSNETAGEHFTPREVIRLMVNILFAKDKKTLTKGGVICTLYDPACGTGGMLSEAAEYIREMNHGCEIKVFGQELNPESYAICKSELLIKNQDTTYVKFGNSFTQDGLSDARFDYMLSNPPFGVEWRKVERFIKDESEKCGYNGRFGAGLPPISDGSLLFLQHMISKLKRDKTPNSTGGRIAVVFNGSPLFSGGAGSGTSDIRKWIIENDMLETIIALPDQLFYNTGISTYIWIVTAQKYKERKGKIQLINATGTELDEKDNPFYSKTPRSLGNKRKELHKKAIQYITEIYADFEDGEYSKIFDNDDFGYQRITIERPKRDENGNIMKDKKGNTVADADLRDYENVPIKEDIHKYFEREVKPHVPDAWIDKTKTKIGYEINFTKYFYKYKPLRSLDIIRREILKLEKETEGMIKKILG